MEKTAMQIAIEWVNDNYPKFNHHEIEAKLTELRDTVEKEQTNTLQSENDRLRERVREGVLNWVPLDPSNPPQGGVLLFTTRKIISKGRWWKNQAGILGFYTEQSDWKFYPPDWVEALSVLEPKDILLFAKIPEPPLTKPDSTGGGEKD